MYLLNIYILYNIQELQYTTTLEVPPEVVSQFLSVTSGYLTLTELDTATCVCVFSPLYNCIYLGMKASTSILQDEHPQGSIQDPTVLYIFTMLVDQFLNALGFKVVIISQLTYIQLYSISIIYSYVRYLGNTSRYSCNNCLFVKERYLGTWLI